MLLMFSNFQTNIQLLTSSSMTFSLAENMNLNRNKLNSLIRQRIVFQRVWTQGDKQGEFCRICNFFPFWKLSPSSRAYYVSYIGPKKATQNYQKRIPFSVDYCVKCCSFYRSYSSLIVCCGLWLVKELFDFAKNVENIFMCDLLMYLLSKE